MQVVICYPLLQEYWMLHGPYLIVMIYHAPLSIIIRVLLCHPMWGRCPWTGLETGVVAQPFWCVIVGDVSYQIL